MKAGLLLTMGASVVLATTVAAQDSPYAGYESRDIKALSPSQIEDLLDGKGMTLALAAELNSYPGPRHVIDFADSLGLTPAQLDATREMFAAMEAEARQLGREILVLEGTLDSLFSSGNASPESVRGLTVMIGEKLGVLRSVHLNAHLQMRALLSDHQVTLYDRLRGYGGGAHEGAGHDMGEHGQ